MATDADIYIYYVHAYFEMIPCYDVCMSNYMKPLIRKSSANNTGEYVNP